jgi:hypothetical protein
MRCERVYKKGERSYLNQSAATATVGSQAPPTALSTGGGGELDEQPDKRTLCFYLCHFLPKSWSGISLKKNGTR